MMKLLLFSVLLRLSASGPTGDDCEALTKPLALEDPSVLAGSAHLLYGYTDSAFYKQFLHLIQSYAFNITVHEGNATFHEEYKLNGTCIGATAALIIKDGTATMSGPDVTLVLEPLPTCGGCYVLHGNSSAKNLDQLLLRRHLHMDHVEDVVNARVLYFFGNEAGAKKEDVERFKKQAHCLGFTTEPDYTHHAEHQLCQQGEGLQL